MFNKNLFKKFLQKGGEEKMRVLSIISILVIIAAVIGMPLLAHADGLTLTVSAKIEGDTLLGNYDNLKCKGYKVINPATFNPWEAGNCPTKTKNISALDFGTLTNQLKDENGKPTGGAGCFYGEDFFIIYLYPDAWGGVGYQFTQTSNSISDADLKKALVFTPVYSIDDRFCWGPDPTNPCTPGHFVGQGKLNSSEVSNNPNINKPILAWKNDGKLVFKAKRPRIIRLQYGISPNPKTGDPLPAPGFVAIPVDKTAGTYGGQIVITMTEW